MLKVWCHNGGWNGEDVFVGDCDFTSISLGNGYLLVDSRNGKTVITLNGFDTKFKLGGNEDGELQIEVLKE